jgi:hypothetical protein
MTEYGLDGWKFPLDPGELRYSVMHDVSSHALRELLEPALRDFHEPPGVPRQIPFGSDSQVQIAN